MTPKIASSSRQKLRRLGIALLLLLPVMGAYFIVYHRALLFRPRITTDLYYQIESGMTKMDLIMILGYTQETRTDERHSTLMWVNHNDAIAVELRDGRAVRKAYLYRLSEVVAEDWREE